MLFRVSAIDYRHFCEPEEPVKFCLHFDMDTSKLFYFDPFLETSPLYRIAWRIAPWHSQRLQDARQPLHRVFRSRRALFFYVSG